MGKRGRGFGRRTVLQLGDFQRGDTYMSQFQQAGRHNEVNGAEIVTKPNALGGLLASYGESDEEDQVEEQVTGEESASLQSAQVMPPPVGAGAVKQNGQSQPGDDTLANFLAEINSISGQSSDIDGVPLSEAPVTSQTPLDAVEDDSGSDKSDTEMDDLREPEAPRTPWQHCLDEGTQCYYYWNTESNEVTWEIPSEYSQHLLRQKEYEDKLATYHTKLKEQEARRTKKALKKAHTNGQNVEKLTVFPPPVEQKLDDLPPGGKDRDALAESKVAGQDGKPLTNVATPAEDTQVKRKVRYENFIKFVSSQKPEQDGQKDEADRKEATPFVHPEEKIGEAGPPSNGHVKMDAVETLPVKLAEKANQEDEVDFDDLDDIDRQLELALERKKAELNKMEEQDESIQKRKASPTAAPPSPKRIKASHETKTQESQVTIQSDLTTNDDKVIKTEEIVMTKKKLDKEEVKLKAEIAELANLITDKFEFLEITRKGLSKLQILSIEIETRLHDWREGGLASAYLLHKLHEASLQLEQYESSAAPPGWSCHWDRSYRRYFYFQAVTGETQWDYPDEPVVPPKTPRPPDHPPPPRGNTRKPKMDALAEDLPPQENTRSDAAAFQSAIASAAYQPPPPPPPEKPLGYSESVSLAASNPPPPPPPAPRHEPPPPGTEPPLPPAEPSLGLSAVELLQQPPPPPPPAISPPPPPPGTTSPELVDMDISEHVDHTIMAAPVLTNAVVVAQLPVYTVPSPSPPAPPPPPPVAIVPHPCIQQALMTQAAQSTSGGSTPSQSPPHGGQPDGTASPTPTVTKEKKKKKEKKGINAGLALKKKNFPSLVQKWQQIQEEVERDHQTRQAEERLESD